MPPGAEARFADLYGAHRAKVWLYCCRRVGADRADDAMGDVFLIAWRRIGEAPGANEALPWLYRIAHFTISNHWRSFARRRRLQSKVDAIGIEAPTSVADQVVVREEARAVVELLGRLKEGDAEILRLAAWEQLSSAQIASVLDISVDAAKQRLSRARGRLADLYQKEKPRGVSTLGKEVRGER